jgi:hypothetical protein
MADADVFTSRLLFPVLTDILPSVPCLLQVCKQTIAARRSLAHEWKIFKDLVRGSERVVVL